MDERAVAVIDLFVGEREIMPIEMAAERVALGLDEIEWALEEFGECTTERYRIVEVDNPAPEAAPVLNTIE